MSLSKNPFYTARMTLSDSKPRTMPHSKLLWKTLLVICMLAAGACS